MDSVDHVETIRTRLNEYLEGKDFFFNSDPEIVESILKAMAMRFVKFGADYCPCRRVTGDKEQDEKIICPCVYHLEELKTQGACHCHLFTKE